VVKYGLRVNGKEYEVEIEDPRAEPVRVVVNGRAFEVSIAEQPSSAPPGPVSRAQPAPELEELYVPTVASTYVETTPVLEEEPTAPPTAASAPGGATSQVTAPMPGKILDIAVQVGSQVKQGEVLCNLEAMKMKSPIRSTAAGTVAQILITEGQTVNFGDALFVLQ
jgi:biotin carboxyl carrier protein